MSELQTQHPPLAYSVNETAKALRLSRTTVCNLIYSGQLKHRKVGRRVLVPRAALERFLRDQ